MKSWDIVIVGAGAAGVTMGFFLRHSDPSLKVLLIDDPGSPPCSLSSTGIVSDFGSKKELFQEAFATTNKFFQKLNPTGVTDITHSFVGETKKRQVYLIDPKNYLAYLGGEKKLSKVKKIGRGFVITECGEKINAKTIILAAGAYLKIEQNIFPASGHITDSSVVPGTFARFDNIHWQEDSFILSLRSPQANLIYRADKKELLLGSADTGADADKDAKSWLNSHRKQFESLLDRPLPEIEEAQLLRGLRHKGAKRQPYWGEIAPETFLISGFYKNGWTLAPLAAKCLTERVLGDCRIL